MNPLFDFSRTHCIAICAFLVPANLLLTASTLYLVVKLQSSSQIYLSACATSLCALALLLHNFTWFSIGVVMVPTYILLVLASICLSLNLWAIAHPASLKQLFQKLVSIGHKITRLTPRAFLSIAARN